MKTKLPLIADLGVRYVKEMFSTALFMHEGAVYRFRDTDGKILLADKYPLTDEHAADQVHLPAAVLKDLSVFAQPPLGYRNIDTGKYGNAVVWLASTRTAHRGMRLESVRSILLPPYHVLPQLGMLYEATQRHPRIKLLYAPKFYNFHNGMNMLRSGKHLGFAVNNNLAIGLSHTRNDSGLYDIYYRERVAGTVDLDGNIKVFNRVVARETIHRQLS